MDAPQTLPLTEPQPGQVISGFVVSHWQSPRGEYCLVVASGGRCHACRVDPVVRLQPADQVQLQAVALENQTAPAWEVQVRRFGTQYELLPGQLCQLRTLPAEQWLQEIQASPLPKLTTGLERVRADRVACESQRQCVNPAGQPELLYATALALARQAVLGPAYAQVCQALQAAAQRSTEAAAALHLHQHVKPDSPQALPSPWAWIRRWREDRALRQQLKLARGSHQRLEAQRRQLERAANEPDTIARVEQEAHRLMEADRSLSRQLATVTREERRASLQLAEALKLVQYLERRRGSQVTLQCPRVKGRARMLPTIAGAALLQPASAARGVSQAPAARTQARPGRKPAAPIPPPEQTLATPLVQPALPAHQSANGHAKSNGVRMRM